MNYFCFVAIGQGEWVADVVVLSRDFDGDCEESCWGGD